MTADSPETPRPGQTLVGAAVAKRIQDLQSGYLRDAPEAVATLAQLRNGAGKLPADTPELWGMTYDPADFEDAWWRTRQGRKAEEAEEHAERAVHIALTLYARHQQSMRDEQMHRQRFWEGEGEKKRSWPCGVGWAVRRLMPPDNPADERLRQRLIQAGKATSVAVVADRLRGIVDLLRRARIPLDYGLLAEQLVIAQQPGGMSEVRSAWGRGFNSYYRREPADSTD